MQFHIRVLYYTGLLQFVSLACFCAPPEQSSKKFWKTKTSIPPASYDAITSSEAPYDVTSFSQAELHGEYPTTRIRSAKSVPHMRINSKSSAEVPAIPPIPSIPHHMLVEKPGMTDSDYAASDALLNHHPIHPNRSKNEELLKDIFEGAESQSRSPKLPFAEKQRDSAGYNAPSNAGPSSSNINSRRGIQPLHLGKVPIEPSQIDWEYKYTRLLIDRLWDHLLAREMNPTIRNLLVQERTALERLVR